MKFSKVLFILALNFIIAPIIIVLGLFYTSTIPGCGIGPARIEELSLGLSALILLWIFAIIFMKIKKTENSFKSIKKSIKGI